VTPEHVVEVAGWQANAPREDEIPFVVARVVLQDFTGVPLLADLAAMRTVAKQMGKNPKSIEPLVPVDLVRRPLDHDRLLRHQERARLNMTRVPKRERYQFMK
jgi:aconitate hydratase